MQTDPRANTETAQSAMYSKWKTITGALLLQQAGNQPEDLAQSFTDVIANIDAVLAPFVAKSVDGGGQRYKNLNMILTRSAKLTFLLFTQPGSFRFDFSGRQGTLVVFPALVQTVDDRGQALSHVRVLLEKETASV
jgi:hypothetical protein